MELSKLINLYVFWVRIKIEYVELIIWFWVYYIEISGGINIYLLRISLMNEIVIKEKFVEFSYLKCLCF